MGFSPENYWSFIPLKPVIDWIFSVRCNLKQILIIIFSILCAYVYKDLVPVRGSKKDNLMFSDTVCLILMIVLINATSKPTDSMTDKPVRCCVPNQYSAQISTSTRLVLLDNQTRAHYVNDTSSNSVVVQRKFRQFNGLL